MSSRSPAIESERLAPAEPGQLLVIWRRFRRHKLAVVGLVMLTTIGLAALLAPWVAPYQFEALDLSNTFGSSTGAHLLGTDELGRDLLTRLMYAGQISLGVGVVSTVIVVVMGTLVGAAAGYFGGSVDTLLMRLVDMLLSIPLLPLLFVISQMLSSYLPSVFTVVLVLSIFGWADIARIVRGQILSLRALDFVEATRALGASSGRIIFRHMLPNSLAPIIVYATLAVGNFILIESNLSYLGYGVKPPVPTWGNMLADVDNYILEHPMLAFYPGLAILLTVVSVNFLGDALRDALDPRLKR